MKRLKNFSWLFDPSLSRFHFVNKSMYLYTEQMAFSFVWIMCQMSYVHTKVGVQRGRDQMRLKLKIRKVDLSYLKDGLS